MEPTPVAPAASPRQIFSIPNVLSFLRLSSVPVFLWLWFSAQREAAVVLYGVGASTDFFDGVIARRTNSVTELGKVLDPLADRIFIVALAVALVGRGTLPWALAIAVVVRDLLVLSLFPVLQRRGVPRLDVNFTGKTATACLLFGLTWLALSETSFGWADIGDEVGLTFVTAGTVLYWVAGGMYAREAARRWKAVERGAS